MKKSFARLPTNVLNKHYGQLSPLTLPRAGVRKITGGGGAHGFV